MLKSPSFEENRVFNTIKLKYKKLSDRAATPTRGSDFAAGYDLYAAHEATILPGGRGLIKTDLQIELPEGCYGRVAPRSGLALKNGIDVGAGVIDRDYRGNLGVILFNFGEQEFKVKKNDRIAQLICERVFCPELVECESLEETERGLNGYGSTGV
uniref:Deoxyuridine 5'-triphosphate nucleotidohydrolase n=1 Tax=Schistosoma japonicum TaxID=6182 RepID=C1L7G7_SCHJA|nr:dUTP pyrophosphatase [Schistosoma japonicum]